MPRLALLPALLALVVVTTVHAVARRGARVLGTHHGDTAEVGAAALVALALVLPSAGALRLLDRLHLTLPESVVLATLAGVVGVGLYHGYGDVDDAPAGRSAPGARL